MSSACAGGELGAATQLTSARAEDDAPLVAALPVPGTGFHIYPHPVPVPGTGKDYPLGGAGPPQPEV